MIEAAVAEIGGNHEVVGAVLVGGREKLPEGSLESLAGLPVTTRDDPKAALDAAIDALRPDVIEDLSDEPVLDYRKRHELISLAMFRGVDYRGAGFHFTPPPRPKVAAKPSVAIIGTGKRTGKTAVGGFAARTARASGFKPAIVAMGRGGPPEPEVLRGDRIELTPQDLLAIADEGRHAASDYIEDALLGRVPTVGCRRCGGGLSGAVEHSNVEEGVERANELDDVDTLLLEGSGAAIPPVHADVTGLVVPASIPTEYLAGYLGLYRMLLADFVVVTMCEEPFGSSSQVSAISSLIERSYRSTKRPDPGEAPRVVRTVFRPNPTRPVDGATAIVATTAPKAAGEGITRHLRDLGCEVSGISHSLSDRAKLTDELSAAKGGADILLCEIKAAGIDTATRWALDAGLEVIYMDNVPTGINGDDPGSTIEWATSLAHDRFGH